MNLQLFFNFRQEIATVKTLAHKVFQIASWISYLWDTNLSRPHFHSKEKQRFFKGKDSGLSGTHCWDEGILGEVGYDSSQLSLHLLSLWSQIVPVPNLKLYFFSCRRQRKGTNLAARTEVWYSGTVEQMHNNISQIRNLGGNLHVTGIKEWLVEPVEPTLRFN